MSGTETFAVLGVISSIISIVDETKQVYDAATNTQGLPEAFRAIAGRLPIIRNILGSAKQHVDEGDVDEDSCKGVKHVVEACEKKAKKLETLFQKAIPKDGASDLERYYKSVKAHGKGNEVENLMKGMLQNVQLLACERGINTATKAQQAQIVKAITDVSAVLPSITEQVFQETGFTNTKYGSGTQYNARGEYVGQGNARQYNAAGGTIYIGSMEDETEKCLTALFLTDPRDDREQLIQAKGSRVVGTCEWIKSNKLYESLVHSRSQLLWLSGGPGKGKTMLSILIAEELEQTAKHSQDILFLQYFCDNRNEKRKTAMAIIRGLIFQLLQSRPSLFSHILPSFQIRKGSLFADSSFETLWRIFESMVRDPIVGTTYCVLDDLDECDEVSLEVLLKKFVALFPATIKKSSICHLNLIVVSRDFPDFIPELLSSFPRIRLDLDADTEINSDINQFIEVKVNELSVYRQYTGSLRAHVKKVFQSRAQGTFLWVGIVAKTLRKYKVTEVKIALDLFPPGLDKLYARMLLQIDIDRRDVAAKILRWVVMAVRPLTLSELSIAIDTTVRPSDDFSHDEVTRDQVSYCGYFLTIKEDQVSLIHQSAKDYFLRKTRDSNSELEFFRVREEVVNLEIARKCLDYLQNGALAAGKVDLQNDTSHLNTFPLLSYAALHWLEHARSLAPSEDIFNLSLSFYHKKSQIRESWLKTYWTVEKYGAAPSESFTILHLASCFGIQPLAENLFRKKGLLSKVKRKLDQNKRYNGEMTALMWAVVGGHEAMVRLLLHKGADLEAKTSFGWTALHLAAMYGDEVVVRLLLEKGADFNAMNLCGQTFIRLRSSLRVMLRTITLRKVLRTMLDPDARPGLGFELILALLKNCADLDVKFTALHLAAENGHETVVRLLLEKGVDFEAKNSFGLTALHLAAEGGHEAVTRLLLEKGAVVEAKAGFGGTVLHRAAQQGNDALVRLLLENGVDVNAKDNLAIRALYEAAEDGHEVVIRLLLEKGADIEAKRSGETALHRATSFGHEAVVRLLLEKGADVNAEMFSGGTALHLAAVGGHEAVVRLLLEKEADVEAKSSGETALHRAADFGHEAVMRLLLEKGMDINAKDYLGWTALHLAARSGHEAVVRLLLNRGADLEATTLQEVAWSGRKAVVAPLVPLPTFDLATTTLQEAARGGHEDVVRLLLNKGADLEAKNSLGWTSLHLAARHGHEATVRLLLEKGADLEAKNSIERTAVQEAARHGYEAMVQLLLEKKAELTAEDSDGDTALHLAARGGHEVVVRQLLDKGGELEAKNSDGETALDLLARGGHEAMVQLLLLEKEAELKAKDSLGWTALHEAAMMGHDAVL
ncbi:Ankyrin-2 [Lobaria immixta]|nr:Ankyrin-2 [Lobaria immixta]